MTTISRTLRLTVALPIALWASSSASQSVVATQSEIRSFLGGRDGLLAFEDRGDGKKLKVIDISDPSLTIRTLDDRETVNPRFSLERTRISYQSDGEIYARNLSGGDAVSLADAGPAHRKESAYWFREGGNDYIIYAEETDKNGYDAARTFKVRMDGIQPVGSAVEIYNKAFDGGPTPDGVWLGEAYGERHAYNTTTQTEYSTFYRNDGSTEGHCCNASMAPMNGL